MLDLIREAPLGQVIRYLSGNRLFQYPEEKSGFELPVQYAVLLNGGHASKHARDNDHPAGNNLEDEKDGRSAVMPESSGDSDADLEAIGILGTVAIYAFGKKLRARSKFAES